VNDLSRRYWIAKDGRKRSLVLAMLAAGLACIALGFATHRDFIAGFGAGFIIVIALVAVLSLFARKP